MKMTLRHRGSSTKCRHVLCRTSKSPHPVEARWLVSPLLMYLIAYIPLLETTPPRTSRSFSSSFLNTLLKPVKYKKIFLNRMINMSIIKNKNLFYLVVSILISFILFLLFTTNYSFVNYLNILFYQFLIYLSFCLSLFIIKNRFFDGITYGLRRFRRLITRSDDSFIPTNESTVPSEKVSQLFYQLVIFQTIALFITVVILHLIYFL